MSLVESALALVPPSWLLATLLALLNVFVFRIAVGREGHSALYFLPWGVFGFALGNLLAGWAGSVIPCLLYTSPSPRDRTRSRMPSSA